MAGRAAWATAERPSVLFDLATARLIDAKVLLPGASVLARSVASARDRAAAGCTAPWPTPPWRHREVARGVALKALGPRMRPGRPTRRAPRRRAELRSLLRPTACAAATACRQGTDAAAPQPGAAHRDAACGAVATGARRDRRCADPARPGPGVLLSHAAREHKDRRYAQLPDLDRAARALRAAVLVLLDPPAGGIEELWNAIDATSAARA